jgi:hypothetical protein
MAPAPSTLAQAYAHAMARSALRYDRPSAAISLITVPFNMVAKVKRFFQEVIAADAHRSAGVVQTAGPNGVDFYTIFVILVGANNEVVEVGSYKLERTNKKFLTEAPWRLKKRAQSGEVAVDNEILTCFRVWMMVPKQTYNAAVSFEDVVPGMPFRHQRSFKNVLSPKKLGLYRLLDTMMSEAIARRLHLPRIGQAAGNAAPAGGAGAAGGDANNAAGAADNAAGAADNAAGAADNAAGAADNATGAADDAGADFADDAAADAGIYLEEDGEPEPEPVHASPPLSASQGKSPTVDEFMAPRNRQPQQRKRGLAANGHLKRHIMQTGVAKAGGSATAVNGGAGRMGVVPGADRESRNVSWGAAPQRKPQKTVSATGSSGNRQPAMWQKRRREDGSRSNGPSPKRHC